MESKLVSRKLFLGRLFLVLCVILFAYSCNLKSEPSLFIPAPQSTLAVGNEPTDVKLGDVNGNGKLDIVTANSERDKVTILPAR